MAETFEVTDSGKAVIKKDPDAILDYSFDWAAWLGPTDTIVNAVAFSDDLTLVIQGTSHDDKIVTVWVGGGFPGGTSSLRCRISTAEGRTDDRTVYLKIRER